MKTARIILGALWLTTVVLPYFPGQTDECDVVCCREMVEVCPADTANDCPTLQARSGIDPQQLSLAGTATVDLPLVKDAPAGAVDDPAKSADPVFIQRHLPLLLAPPGVYLLI